VIREPVFDTQGTPVAWLLDQEVVVCAKTRKLGFIDRGFVFTPDGQPLGELHNGYFWDRAGEAVGFLTGAFGGPPKPARKVAPLAPVLQAPRVRARLANPPSRLTRFLGWSAQSFAEYLA
jgi:hypothetical protein